MRRDDRSDRKVEKVINSDIATPAMEAGIVDHVWTLEEIINLVDRENDKE